MSGLGPGETGGHRHRWQSQERALVVLLLGMGCLLWRGGLAGDLERGLNGVGALDSSWMALRPGQARAEDSSPAGPQGAERRRVRGAGEGGGRWEGSGPAGGWRAGSGETPGLDVAGELDSTACGVPE